MDCSRNQYSFGAGQFKMSLFRLHEVFRRLLALPRPKSPDADRTPLTWGQLQNKVTRLFRNCSLL